MDIRTALAANAYGTAKPLASQAGSATQTATSAIRSFSETLQENEETATKALTGSADPQALVQALAETQLAVETAVTVRDRVVEAYQEILRMPV